MRCHFLITFQLLVDDVAQEQKQQGRQDKGKKHNGQQEAGRASWGEGARGSVILWVCHRGILHFNHIQTNLARKSKQRKERHRSS